MAREFDAIVFGASGFTGQFIVEEMAISMEMDSLYKRDNLKWAISGRNEKKLRTVLENAAKNTNIEWCKQVPIIEANVDNYESLLNLCKRTRLILTAVGPYRFYGEPLVKACVEAGTNYVDISGEPQFIEGMQLKYNEEAKRKNIHIVSASGWDSVPADMGTTWTKQQFPGDLNHVEIFVSFTSPQNEIEKSAALNFGTWQTAIYGYAFSNELKPIRKQLYKDVLPMPPTKSNYSIKKRSILGYVDEIKGYCLPFMGSDKTVVKRSEIYKYNLNKERPVNCETYFKVGKLSSGIMIIMVASIFALFAKFSFGRYLLEKFPGFFSLGSVSKEGVPRRVLEKKTFTSTIIGYGWNEKLNDPDMQHNSEPKKKIVTQVTGPDPGYIGTAILLVHCGMTILFDKEKLSPPGVITPGACFKNSYLIDRLSKRNVNFEVLERFD